MYPVANLIVFSLAFLTQVHGSCKQVCMTLSKALPSQYFPESEAQLPLWSEFQARVRPLCRLEPETPENISTILDVVVRNACHFAITGGGTSPFRGASNADKGVTINMRRMKGIAFVERATNGPALLSVGAGSLWADVYRALEPYNMSATGTRNSLTGVVGSILGGGISFFSEHHGWACDTVVEFEVVLANGTVAKANEYTNPDLFWALKGGGNNFGIVTNAVIEVFRDPPTWYTFQRFNITDMAAVFDRLEKHTSAMPPHVWQIATTLQWHVPTSSFVISERMVASELPELPESVPLVVEGGGIVDSPVLQTNAYQRSILAMAQKMAGMNEGGFFNFFGSVTVRSNAAVAMALADIFKKEVGSIKNEPGLQVNIVYNPLTRNALRQMKQRGGNALGLLEEDGPLIVVNINLRWGNENSEPKMRQFIRRLIGQFRETAETMGMLHPYIFQNHAFEEQDVFVGSGHEKLARLRAVGQAVDPGGVFQTLQPGYFKLGRNEEIIAERSEL